MVLTPQPSLPVGQPNLFYQSPKTKILESPLCLHALLNSFRKRIKKKK
jgi:hypothetical protein